MQSGNIKGQEKNIDEILQNIFDNRGFDIRNYKMSEVQRRVSRRMNVLEISSLVDYSEYLKTNPDEYEALFNTILVNVAQFFRSPDGWNFVRESLLPEILERDDEIRIWSVGCASGEEPYSVAIMLAEMLGDDLSKYKVKIFATDIDESALKFARSGKYTLDQLTGLSEDMREKYFTRSGDVYNIVRDIRRLLIFSRHNLVSDPPLSRIDLLLCRNVLIYFDQKLRSRIISRLQYALSDVGYLWLGKTDMPITDSHGVKLLNTEWRIFKKLPSYTLASVDNANYDISHKQTDIADVNDGFEQVMQNMKTGFIMLDKNFSVVSCNQTIQNIWGVLPEQILGKSFFELEISYCPVDLRYKIEQVVTANEPLVIEKVEYWITNTNKLYLKINIIPLVPGVMLFVENVTDYYELIKELKLANKALEIGHEKLLSANEKLETLNNQLQAINEELQSTNMEMESINEELSSRITELNIPNQ